MNFKATKFIYTASTFEIFFFIQMKRTIFRPVKIESFDTDYIKCIPQANAFFELVFVESGSGKRTVDNCSIPFQCGDLFLHLPKEKNAITLNEHSVLHFIKFQKVFFYKNQQDVLDIGEWFSNIAFILSGNNQHKQNLISITQDEQIVQNVFNIIIKEHHRLTKFTNANIKAFLFTLLNIVTRNILSDGSIGLAIKK